MMNLFIIKVLDSSKLKQAEIFILPEARYILETER